MKTIKTGLKKRSNIIILTVFCIFFGIIIKKKKDFYPFLKSDNVHKTIVKSKHHRPFQ